MMVRAALLAACAAMGAPADFDSAGRGAELGIRPPTEFMLTFDDGPLPGATDRVLDALAGLKAADGRPVRAGFFLVGDAPRGFWRSKAYYALYELWPHKGSMVRHPGLVRRIDQAGHIIGNHTAHHAWFRWPWLATTGAIRGEIAQWETDLRSAATLPSSHLFRPPYLADSNEVCEAVRSSGYRVIAGQTVGDTRPGATAEQIEKNVRRILEGWDQSYPCVLIFHDIRGVTYEHMGDIVRHLQHAGFRLAHFDPSRLPNRDTGDCERYPRFSDAAEG